MRFWLSCLLLFGLAMGAVAQDDEENSKTITGPTNEKAIKTYKEGMDYLHQRQTGAALEAFKKADKQDAGHCIKCQKKMIKYGLELGDWKAAETGAEEMVAEADSPTKVALTHYQLGLVLRNEAMQKNREEIYSRAHDEMTEALVAAANFPDAYFADGMILAHLKKDDEAKKQFEQFVKMKSDDDPNRQRAMEYIVDPDLARARMAPAFSVTTSDGQRLSLDGLKGKVVLVDFWATWCPSCREAVPHIKEIAKKFQGQPLVILSVSLDDDEKKWKDFMAKNEMTWLQCRDVGFKGGVAELFGVQSIPQTFTIDANGVLQDQHIGDSAMEGKIKKLVARAQDMAAAKNVAKN
jgi:thiol-disulfide isomerase/thioredoxin